MSSVGVQDAIQAALADAEASVGLRDAEGRDVPVIDLTSPDAARRVWEAASTSGFFTVTNHGVDPGLIDQAFGASEAFFALGRAVNERQSPRCKTTNSGYDYMQQRPATGLADQKEALDVRMSEEASRTAHGALPHRVPSMWCIADLVHHVRHRKRWRASGPHSRPPCSLPCERWRMKPTGSHAA